MALTPGRVTSARVHHDDLGARVLHELGDRRAHAGGAADDQCSLAVVPECVEQRH